MTRSHCWRCSNTLYIYKEDLLWVWTVWGVTIISTNRGSKCESMHITLRSMRAYIRLELHPYMTHSHCWRCSNTLYIYKEDLLWVWTGWGVLIISTNWESTFCTHDIHSQQVIESKYQGVVASLWPVPTVAGAELHYICIKKTCYESEVDGGSQS